MFLNFFFQVTNIFQWFIFFFTVYIDTIIFSNKNVKNTKKTN